VSHATPPDAAEFAPYYQTYVAKVPAGDIRRTLREQRDATMAFLREIPGSRAGHRYAEGKWDLREVLCHINDTERVFAFRLWWFARGLPGELPSFDQEVAVAHAATDERTWSGLIDEFEAIRSSTLHLVDALSDEAWLRRGIASGNPFTVRALAWITAGHVEHHVRLIRERYLAG
jgi:hypothetical protein